MLRPLLLVFAAFAASASAQTPGQILGHVYRADSGAPIEGAVMFLQRSAPNTVETKVPPVRTNKDGSYVFSGLAAGNYVIMAYRSGFVGPVVYGSESPMIEPGNGLAFFCPRNNAAYACISVSRGRKVAGIDVRLTANPNVDSLPIEPFAAATFPDHKVSFDKVHFSPDGQMLVVVTNDSQTSPGCPCEVWLHDMRSHRSVLAVTTLPKNYESVLPEWRNYNRSATPSPVILSGWVYLLMTWGSDDTLYIEAGDYGPFSTGEYGDTKIAATLTGVNEIEQFPSEVTTALQLQFRRDNDNTVRDSEGRPKVCTQLVGRNDQFVVTIQEPPDSPNCRGEQQLIVARSDGTDERKISGLDLNLLREDAIFFDAEGPMIISSNPGELFTGAISTFGLTTGKNETILVPYNFRLRLLDSAKNGMVAYSVRGPCAPDDSFEQTLIEWAEPTNANFRGQYSPIENVCFLKLP